MPFNPFSRRKPANEAAPPAQTQTNKAGSANPLLAWLNSCPIREQHRYLEAHPELLGAQSDIMLAELEEQYRQRAQPLLDSARPQLEQAIARSEPFSDELWKGLRAYGQAMDTVDYLHTQRQLLADIRTRRGANADATPAIREGYVNARGGWRLDLPPWLKEIDRHLSDLRDSGPANASAAARIALLRPALARAQQERSLEPVIVAELIAELRIALNDSLGASANPAATQEEARALLESLPSVYTADRFPQRYAMTQNNLGAVYQERIAGEKRANQEYAIACYEAALTIHTADRFPQQYATIQNNLGLVYRQRIAGEKRANQERAIACYEAALTIRTADRFPQDYAATQNNLGIVYRERIAGEQHANQERAIACYEAALTIRTADRFPQDYAMTQNNLGNVYQERLAGEQRANQERAIACFEAALTIYTTERFPQQYATIQNNLGNVYRQRIAGEQRANQERAIACYEAALTIRTVERFPQDYAATQNNLGLVYRERIAGEQRANQERAIACYEAALTIRTADRFPIEHRLTQQNRARVAMDAGRWTLAHEAWQSVLTVEEVLLTLSGGVAGADAALAESQGAALYDGYALARLGRDADAALAIERGRARGLAEAQRMQAANPARIGDPVRRAGYVAARDALARAQMALNAPMMPQELQANGLDLEALATAKAATRQTALESATRAVELQRGAAYSQAKAAFDALVAEIRTARDPEDFLLAGLEMAALRRAAARGGPGHALVYLGATRWGGLALGVFAAQVATLDLPRLTYEAVRDLIQRPLTPDDGRLIGGYVHAQEGGGFSWLLQDWPGATLRERAQGLRDACLAAGVSGALETAAWRAIGQLGAVGRADLADAPLETLNAADYALIAGTLNAIFLRLELRRSLTTLADAALRPLAAWLRAQGATGVTLIPCGQLAAFPLAAAEIAPGVTFGDQFPTSVAPSARALLRDEARRTAARNKRVGVAALGDPRPTHQPLRWGEAEALTLAKLARQRGLSAEARVGAKARRGWLLNRLANALLVDASCHGQFDSANPLDSALLLAGALGATEGMRLALRDLLNQGAGGQAQLLGLRLLILSACQTSILDLRKSQDEARSLTAGVLEAGADAAMGALWSVDDKATYLLITKFAQVWLRDMETMPPAAALAQAQQWLRSVTNRELRQWRYDSIPEMTTEERAEAGSAEPQGDPWREAQPQPVGADKAAARTATVRGAGERLDVDLDDLDDLDGAGVGAEARANREPRYDPREAQYKVQSDAPTQTTTRAPTPIPTSGLDSKLPAGERRLARSCENGGEPMSEAKTAKQSPMLTGIETLIGLVEEQARALEFQGAPVTKGGVSGVRGAPEPGVSASDIAEQMEDLDLFTNRLRQIHDWLRADPRLLPIVDDAIGKQVRALESRQARQNITLAVITTIAGAILGWLISLLGTPLTLLHTVGH